MAHEYRKDFAIILNKEQRGDRLRFALRITSCHVGYCTEIRSWPICTDRLSSKRRLQGSQPKKQLLAKPFIQVHFKSVSSATLFKRSYHNHFPCPSVVKKGQANAPKKNLLLSPKTHGAGWWDLRRQINTVSLDLT